MDLFANLAIGFGVALTIQNLLYCFVGVLLGTLIGVLPGIGPVATIAMLLPITFALPPVSALIMLAGIYYGAQYGGSTTAILVNLPGEASSVVTCLDGYQMARQGRAGAALAIAALGSFFAGTVATLLIAAFAPPLAEVALKFGPAEYFSLMVLGLIAAVVLARGSLLKAIAMIVLGLLLGIVGTDVNSGVARFTFGMPELADGIGFVVVAMGLFGFAEIIVNLGAHREARGVHRQGVEPDADVEGLQGGAAGHAARHRHRLGARHPARRRRAARRLRRLHGREEDRQGPVAVRQGRDRGRRRPRERQQCRRADLVHPAADARHPVQRGDGADGRRDDDPRHPARPAGDDQQPELFWGLIASMWIGNLMLVVLNLPLIGIWVKLLTVPYRLLYPAILLFCCIGVYSLQNNIFDVMMTVVFGFSATIFVKLDCEPAPLLLGFVLGPMMEENLRRAMLLSRGDPTVFVTRPISAVMLLDRRGPAAHRHRAVDPQEARGSVPGRMTPGRP